MAIAISILYRGPLADCNYACGYCPLATHRETSVERSEDRAALVRFSDWVESRTQDRLSLLMTPWGEALVRPWYRDALVRWSRLPHVAKVAVQTNLSCTVDWIDRCDAARLALWCTYHPTQVSRAVFLARCDDLIARGIRFSVGMVGMRESFDEIEAMRRELPRSIYLWINACKDRGGYYQDDERRRLESIDPLFHFNMKHHASRGEACRTGQTVISVDGKGDVRRCHFVREVLGNLYRETDPSQFLDVRPCPARQCGCHIGYVYLERLKLEAVFDDGLFERIPKRSIW